MPEMRLRMTIKETIAVTIIVATSLVSFAITLVDGAFSSEYHLFFLMPLFFIVGFMIIATLVRDVNRIYCTITSFAVILVYYIRMVITPMFMALGEFDSVLKDVFVDYYSIAILISCMEWIIVSFFLPKCIKKIEIIRSDYDSNLVPNKIIEKRNKPHFFFWIIVLVLALFIVYVIRMDSSVMKSVFLLITDTERVYTPLSDVRSGISTLSMYVEMLESAFKMIQVLFPPLIAWYIVKVNINTKIKFLAVFILFVLITIIATENRMDAIVSGIAFMLTMKVVFGDRFAKAFKYWMIIVFIIGIVGLSIKAGVITGNGSKEVDFRGISGMLAAYFSGIPTVAAGIDLSNSLEGINLFHLFPDILNKIPYFTYGMDKVFGITIPPSSSQLFNDMIESNFGKVLSQILPTTALGFEYFFAFGFILPCFMIWLATKLECIGITKNDIISINLYNWIIISVAISTVVTSAVLVVTKIIWFIVMILIISMTNNNREKSIRTY